MAAASFVIRDPRAIKLFICRTSRISQAHVSLENYFEWFKYYQYIFKYIYRPKKIISNKHKPLFTSSLIFLVKKLLIWEEIPQYNTKYIIEDKCFKCILKLLFHVHLVMNTSEVRQEKGGSLKCTMCKPTWIFFLQQASFVSFAIFA